MKKDLHVSVADGKYTVVHYEDGDGMIALRYGCPWLEITTANNLIYSLAFELNEARQALHPFAELLQSHHEGKPDDYPVFAINGPTITLGDLRRAFKIARQVTENPKAKA